MPGNNYQKKPIINPERLCALKECNKPFTASRQDQIFHIHQCGEKDWRLKHKRVRILKKSTGTTKGTPTEAQRRDTPERWMAYMEKNLGYAAMVTRGQSLADVQKSMIWS